MPTIAIVDINSLFVPAWKVARPDDPASGPHDWTISRVRRIAETADHVAIAIDSPPYDRTALFAEYKAHRRATAEELADRDAMRAQLDRVVETLRYDGFAVYGVRGLEADDIIASLVTQAPRNLEIVIWSGDKDLMQLIGPGVILQSPRASETGALPPPVSVDDVVSRFGVGPELVGDWLALTGDTSDNVPGVPTIGPKRATQILATYGSLDLALTSAEHGDPEMPEKMRELLAKHADQARISRRLVELRTDAPVSLEDALQPRVPKPLAPTESTYPGDEPDPEEIEMQDVPDAEFEAANDPAPAEPAAQPPAPPESAPSAEAPKQQEAPKVAPATTATATKTEARKAPMAIVRAEPGTDAWAMALEPPHIDGAEWLAKQIYNSRVYGTFPTWESALCAIIQGRELGLPAIASMRLTHVIEGKLAMSAMMIIGLVHKSKMATYFKPIERTSKRSVWKGHRKGDPDSDPTIVEYTIEDAERAKLPKVGAKGPNNWITRPTEMLSKTAGVQLARLLWPDVVGGLYFPEEFGIDDYELPEAA